MRHALILTVLGVGITAAPIAAIYGQTPGRCEVLASQRTSVIGCYLLDSVALGLLPDRPVYWHVYSFPSLGSARAIAPRHGVAVDAFGRGWVLSIAERGWRPDSGTRIAVVGPLPTLAGRPHTARFMESRLNPGFRTRVHRHDGSEATVDSRTLRADAERLGCPAARFVTSSPASSSLITLAAACGSSPTEPASKGSG